MTEMASSPAIRSPERGLVGLDSIRTERTVNGDTIMLKVYALMSLML